MRFATAGAGGNMPPPVTPDPQSGLWGWAAAGVMALFGSGGLFVAWVNRKAGLDKLVETRLSQYVETLNRDLDGLRDRNRELQDDVQELQQRCLSNEKQIYELSQSLDVTTRENDQLKAENTKLKALDLERIEQLAAAQHLLLDREVLINERKAENSGLLLQLNLMLGQIARFQDRLISGRSGPQLGAVVGQGKLTIDSDGLITECDRGAIALYGAPLKGLSVLEMIPHRFHGGHLKGFADAISTGKLEHPGQVCLLRADGSEIQVRMELELLRTTNGKDRLRFRAVLKTVG